MQLHLSVPPSALRRRVPRPSNRQTAIAALIVGAACFGLGTVATKGALDGIPPLTLAAGRFAVAALVLTALCRARGIERVYDRRAALLGLTGIALPFGFQNLGLTNTSAGSAVLLIEGGVPLMTAVLGVVFLRERIGWPCLCGLVLGVGGVVAVAVEELGGKTPVSGAVLALASAAAFAVYTVLGRRIFRGGFSLGVLTGGTTLGTLMLVPLVGLEVRADGMPTPDLGDLGLLLFLGLVGSAATQLLWAHGMAHLSVAEIGVFGTFIPIVGIAAAALLLGEPISAAQLLGAALIAGGMVVTVQTAPLRRPRLLRRGPRPVVDPILVDEQQPTRPTAQPGVAWLESLSGQTVETASPRHRRSQPRRASTYAAVRRPTRRPAGQTPAGQLRSGFVSPGPGVVPDMGRHDQQTLMVAAMALRQMYEGRSPG